MTWCNILKPKSRDAHKYDYGHVVVFGGAKMTGAACLAGKAALRMGAGLVTIVSPVAVANVYRSYCPSLIVEEEDDSANFQEHFQDRRRNAILIGPGASPENKSEFQEAVLDSVRSDKICVLDADALTVFAEHPSQLLSRTHQYCVLTPHEGEFEKLFPDIDGEKIERSVDAARRSSAIVVLKGHETVVAHPDGRHEIFTNGSPWLATAGTGDVLAGMITGFGAYHREELFEAVCVAVWMHGEASQLAGAGMISADLPDTVPLVMKKVISGGYPHLIETAS